MLIHLLYMTAGLVLLAVGAEVLVRGASSLALRSGITPLVVGLTIVAIATGSPELFVSVKGALVGDAGIALGNVIGSNISNLLLVLGAASAIAPLHVRSQIVRREMPLMATATALLVLLMTDGVLSRGDGALLVTGAVAYLYTAYRGAKRGQADAAEVEFAEELRLLRSRAHEIAFVLGGVALLVAGAESLTRGAVALASDLGVSSAVIALTIVAIGTSLPELATSIAAARREEDDVAFGNVIGSNTFNILGVLGLVALLQPLQVTGLRTLDLVVLVAAPLLVLLLMVRGWLLARTEGLLLLAAYAAYLVTLAI